MSGPKVSAADPRVVGLRRDLCEGCRRSGGRVLCLCLDFLVRDPWVRGFGVRSV